MTGYREEIARRLKDAREAAGLSLSEVSAAIRVRPVYLTAIEAGEFERLPALPQTLGFTRSYARYLDVDVDEPLSHLGEEIHRHIDSADYSEPEPVWTVSPRRAGYVSAGVVLAALVLGFAFIDLSDEPPVSEPQTASLRSGAARATASVPVDQARPVTPAPAAETLAVAQAVPADAPVTAQFHAQMLDALAGEQRISSVDEVPVAESVSGTEAAAVPAGGRFVKSDVYLRSEPSNAGSVVGVLNGCELVSYSAASESGQWARVDRSDGAAGWVFGAYLSDEKPARCG